MLSKSGSLTKRFAANRKGSVGVIFALALMPILLATGAAIDYSNSARVRGKLEDALDAGAIAAAKAMAAGLTDEAQLKSLTKDFVDENLAAAKESLGTLTGFNVAADFKTGRVTVVGSMIVPTYMLGLAGIEDITVDASAVAAAASKNIELVMMLDVTGSMAGSKISSLRTAATDLVNILIPDQDYTSDKVKIGIVPYSQGVNAGPFAKKTTLGKSDKCATERVGADAFTDALYDKEAVGTGSTACPPNVIQPLTTNRNILNGEIAKLDAGGMTAGQTGIVWSWYMLSPNWASLWPGDSAPAAYDGEKVMKIVVLMTDGDFNTFYDLKKSWYWYGSSSYEFAEFYDSTQPTTRAKKLCDAMKESPRNIHVYTVAFQAPWKAKAMLKYCASADDTYFDASSGDELEAAFAAIANDVQKLRLTE